MNQIVKKDILGVGISNASAVEVVDYIFSSIDNNTKPYFIVTPNPEMIVRSTFDTEFKQVLNKAELSLCDGMGLLIASRLLRAPLKTRITGTDLVDLICKESVRKPVCIGFLGGKGSVALKTAECLVKKYPGLNVCFVASEWSDEGFKTEVSSALNVPNKKIDILFVAFGFPKQEIWMSEQVNSSNFKVAVGVGGAFDYISGNVPRAPSFMRLLGFEWLYRLVRQPWRWKRQRALFSFIVLVMRELIGGKSTKNAK